MSQTSSGQNVEEYRRTPTDYRTLEKANAQMKGRDSSTVVSNDELPRSSCRPESIELDENVESKRTKIKLTLLTNKEDEFIDEIEISKRETSFDSSTSKERPIDDRRTRSGEFTLPTNPPITVTIEPQSSNSYETLSREHCFHDDQIYSPENVHSKEKRSSLDPSLRGTSNIVNYLMDLLKPSDNKLAMKLFGSRKGVLKERLRQQRAGHCIIHPCSNFRFVLICSLVLFIERMCSIFQFLLGLDHVDSAHNQRHRSASGHRFF